MALFLMEPEDFVSDITSMQDPELHMQLAWFVSWLKSTGFKTAAQFVAHIEKEIQKSVEKYTKQSLDTNASLESHNKHKADWDSKQQDTATRIEEMKAFVDNYQLGFESLSPAGQSQMELQMDEIKAAEDEARAARMAYEESGDDLNCHFLFSHLQMNETEMWREVLEKANRMMALEAEFERRNKVAKAIAEYDAYLKGIEFTWTPPQLPDFIHAENVSISQEYPCQFVPNPAMAQDEFEQDGLS